MIFLHDEDHLYSYDDLLCQINNSTEYYPLYKAGDLFCHFINLINALVSSQPLTLLDSDVNASEINIVDKSKINAPKPICRHSYSSIGEIISDIQKSSSQITIFTSGTTGQPKKVVHNISTLTRSVRYGDKYRGQVWAYAYNPTHMAGLQVFFQAFVNLNTLVNVFNKSRVYVYNQIISKHVTHISATPSFYRLLLPFEKEYPSVVRVTLGGEKSDEHLYNYISKIFPNAKINNVYASTEAGSLFAAKGDCFQIPETIREQIKIEEDELLIHKSLLGKSESFQFFGDFYHSGDLVEWVDKASGLFRFKSRKNELINVGGYKINPAEVENAILAIAGVQNAFVYGKPNSILGYIVCADIKLEPSAELTEIEIKKKLASQLQDFKIPRRIRFVDNMPLTRTGKLKRS